MPRVKKGLEKDRFLRSTANSISVKKRTEGKDLPQSFLQKLQSELQLNQSYVSLVLGLLIVLVGGVLVFNYFKTNQPGVGPSQSVTENTEADVKPEDLPGQYTVKEGDTLFLIAEKYYEDGYKYPELAKANNISNENIIEVGEVLEVPKLEEPTIELATSEETVSEETSSGEGTGGAVNQTIWGEKIEGETYTVAEGDWLSKIAGRAYGDIMAYDKIAQANDITNPDLIEPGTVLKIPR